MAIRIPDAPNIIGSEPVLRSPEQVRGATLTPQFKTDVSAETDAAQAVGTLLANVNQERVDTYMTQASLWWTEMMNKKVREVEDKYKGAAAMDLYVKELKPYAQKLNDDLFGKPKDDGVVRISNPQLQTAFKKWSDGQMRTYNAQIGRYEGQELARYNESTFDAREQQISEGLLGATTPEEIVGYSQSMLDLDRIRYRGYNPDRITQLAAAKVDAAVTKNVEARINDDVEKGYSFYTDPQVQAALSSTSKASLRQSLRKALVDQGEARGGEGLANNDGSRVAHYADDEVIRQIYGTDDPEVIRGVQLDIMGKANDRAKALMEKSAGVQSQIAAGLSADLANATTEDDFYNTLERVYEFDSKWGDSLQQANQRDALDARLVRFVASAAPGYDSRVASMTDTIVEEINNPVAPKLPGRGGEMVQARVYNEDEYDGRIINSSDREHAMAVRVSELEMSGLSHDNAVRKVARDEARLIAIQDEDNPAKLEAMAEYNVLRDRLAKDGETYTAVMNDIVAGTYTGGRDDRVDALPLYMQRDLYAAVGTEGEYRRLVNSHPGVSDVFNDVDATYANLDVGYKERAKRMAMKRVSDWERKNGDTAKGQQLRQLVEQGYADAKDPVSNAMESAIREPLSVDDLRDTGYWSREQRTDLMAEQKRTGVITSAATSAFGETPKKVSTKASDRSWDKQTAMAEARVKKLKNKLPTELRYVVDLNKDLYVNWYRLGNTNAIINHINAHRSNY